MGDDDVAVGMGVGHEVVVGDLEEGGHRGGFVAGAVGPRAGRLEAGDQGRIGLEEERKAGQKSKP